MGKRQAEIEETEHVEPTTEKKKKKQKVAEEEPVVADKAKKKKKEKAALEEEYAEPVKEKKKKKKEIEEDAEEEPAPKKKKKDKAIEEDAEEEPAPKKKKEKKEDAEEASKAEGPFEIAVKNLPWTVDEEGLEKSFGEAGTIESCRLLKDSEGWSRGMAFIRFATQSGLDAALKRHDTELEGRSIRVELAQNRTGQQSKGKGKGGPGEKPDGCLSVMVMQLSQAIEEDDLWEIFEDCGTVSKVKLLYDRDTNASRGMAFVDFEETEATDKAVKMTDKEIKGKAIYVKYNTPREPKGKGKGW